MREKPYEKLLVWQRADQLVKEVYSASVTFPSEEKFGITSQLRRATVSVVLNIVEGQSRGSRKDFVRFLYIARGSLAESGYLIKLSAELGYLSNEQYTNLTKRHEVVSFLLYKFITSLK
jgi:four helix bundle protein